MTTKRGSKRRKLAAKLEKGNTATDVKSKVRERTRPKSNEPSTKTHKILRSAQLEVEHERQARNKPRKNLVTSQLKSEQEHQAGIKRGSFVVRLTVDEHGQLGRTEIEHVPSSSEHISSGRKQNFLNPDGESLIAFMKECISPTIIKTPIIPVPRSKGITTLRPEPPEPKSRLFISAVRMVHLEYPDILTLVLTSEEPFIVQARFQLHSLEPHLLTSHGLRFDVKVYASEITSGKSKTLTTYDVELIQNIIEYQVEAEVPGLAAGFYRLFTLVTLGAPIKAAGCYDGPVIEVI